jgi:hypothetical protein
MQLPELPRVGTASEVAAFMPRSKVAVRSCVEARAKEVRTLSQHRGMHDFLNVPRKIRGAPDRALFGVLASREIATKQCVARAASASTVRITHRYALDLPFHAALARVLLAL